MEFFKKLLFSIAASILAAYAHAADVSFPDKPSQQSDINNISPYVGQKRSCDNQATVSPKKRKKGAESTPIDHQEFIDFIKEKELSKHLMLVTFIKNALNSGKFELAKFVKKYTPPKTVCTLIELHAKSIVKQKNGPIEQFPGFYIKGTDLARIINAERMHTCIKRHNLNCLDVAQKYVYPINGTLYVFARTVDLGKNRNKPKITIEEARQLATLVEETGYKDLSLQNVIRNTDGKLVIIDTEDRSFLGYQYDADTDSTPWCKLQFLANLLRHVAGISSQSKHRLILEDEAKQWLENRYSLYKSKRVEMVKYTPPLPYMTHFDDPDIDFELVKKELGF
jgi:hypothetical protein